MGGITNSFICGFARSGPYIFAASEGGNILRTADLGKTWTSVKSNFTPDWINCIAANDSILLVGTNEQPIWRSTDNGTSWLLVDSNIVHIGFGFAFQDSTIYAAVGTDILFSTDGGLRWNATGIGKMASVGQSVDAVAVMNSTLFANAITGSYVTSNDGALFRTTNSGAKWTACELKSPIVTMAVNDSILFIGTINGVYKTSDYGVNCISAGLNSQEVDYLLPYKNYLFACTNQGLYFTADNGGTWVNESEGLNDPVDAIIIIDSTVYASTSSTGMWTRSLSEIVTRMNKKDDHIAISFALAQNYPNPFNPTTVISYQLPANNLVTLKVYDILGRLVSTLVSDRQTAGAHSVTFNATNLSSGVYFYRLQAGTSIETKKLLLLK